MTYPVEVSSELDQPTTPDIVDSSPAGRPAKSPGPLMAIVKNEKIAFLIVGVANTVIGALWFIAFEVALGSFAGYMVSLLMAHIASVLCAFSLYRWLVFRVRGHVLRDLIRFEMVYLGALALNAVLLVLFVEAIGFEPIPAQLMIVFLSAMISYVGHKRFSFRRPPIGAETLQQ